MISILTLKITLVLLLCGHPNFLILSSPSLSVNYHFSIFELFPYDLHIHVTRFRKYPLSLSIFDIINRGYYMAARRYQISVRVLKNFSQVSAAKEWKSFSTQEEKFRISVRPCNVLFIKQRPMKFQTISLLKIAFCCERRNYYAAIVTVIFQL